MKTRILAAAAATYLLASGSAFAALATSSPSVVTAAHVQLHKSEEQNKQSNETSYAFHIKVFAHKPNGTRYLQSDVVLQTTGNTPVSFFSGEEHSYVSGVTAHSDSSDARTQTTVQADEDSVVDERGWFTNCFGTHSDAKTGIASQSASGSAPSDSKSNSESTSHTDSSDYSSGGSTQSDAGLAHNASSDATVSETSTFRTGDHIIIKPAFIKEDGSILAQIVYSTTRLDAMQDVALGSDAPGHSIQLPSVSGTTVSESTRLRQGEPSTIRFDGIELEIRATATAAGSASVK